MLEPPVYRIWCILHQLDIPVQHSYESLGNESWLNQTTALVGSLRQRILEDTEFG